MTTKLISLAIVFAILIAILMLWHSAAHATVCDNNGNCASSPQPAAPAPPVVSRDVRDYWAMTCFPSRSSPYRVEFKGRENSIVITSTHGVHHHYHIVENRSVLQGFVVRATDFNIGRTIMAVFGPNGGGLASDAGEDVCSGDL
jgi:hypothetical protein